MAAQAGDGIVLLYGPQGAQQDGSAILLDTTPLPGSTRVAARTAATWRASAGRRSTVRALHDAAQTEDRCTRGPWAQGIQLDAGERSAWGLSTAADDRAGVPWGHYERRVQPEPRAPWGLAAPLDDRAGVPWGRYERRVQPEPQAPWGLSTAADDRAGVPWGRYERRVQPEPQAPWGLAAPVDATRYVPWVRFGRVLAPGWGIVIPVHDPDAAPPEALYIVPIRRVYMQLNTASLRRVVGDIALPTFSMSISLDMGSWVWSFNASLPADALVDVEPSGGDPVELEALVNGTAFRFLVEQITRERTFGKTGIQISGRGKAAMLDAPYAPLLTFSNSEARTMQQLMDSALLLNGVSLGWTVTWGGEDWLVPAGVFLHRGSHMSALNRIAAAAGAYVQPHPSAASLLVLPQYPAAPWDWGTVAPDYELPSAVMTREGIEWVDKPLYNRVYVCGEGTGVLGRVTRAATAGDLVAPMVADALITTAAAARQRGLPLLADTGRIANVSLRLPVLAETGVIKPGAFVRYIDGGDTRIGLVRSTTLDVAMPDIWQTIGVETHA